MLINSKTYGIIRNRHNDFLKIKNKKLVTKKRFSKAALRKTYQLQDVAQSSLLTPQTRPSDVQMSDYNDEPQWISQYHKCQRILCEVDELTQEIVKQQGKKMMSINQKKHDQIIQRKMIEATERIQNCQKTLKSIQKNSKQLITNQHQNKIFSSMIVSLAINIKDKAKKLRNIEQSQLSRNKQLAQYTKNIQLECQISNRNETNFGNFQEQSWLSEQTFQVLQERMMKQRNQQIMKIVKSIHSLNTIYKQLQQLVIHQGSLLDRIDQNIQTTHQHVIKANQHLQKAEQYQKSGFAKKVMLVLIALIVIFAVILIIKYT